MNILFDGSHLQGRKGGVSSYLQKLLPGLRQVSVANGDNFELFNLYCRRKARLSAPLADVPGIRNLRFPVKLLNYSWIYCGQPDLSWLYPEINVFHGPHFSLPVISKARKILTVNDIIYLKHPEYYNPRYRKLNDYGYKTLLSRNIMKADRIIAISRFTKNDLVNYYQIPEDKVKVVYLPIDVPGKLPHDKLVELLKIYNLKINEYIYFPVGTFEFRKNIATTVDAFKKTMTAQKLKLVVSGVGDFSSIMPNLESDTIIVIQWNDEQLKKALYQGSLFVVYPSLYEGFGMPVIEAMANGKAVLTSNGTSLSEIAGDSACLVDPHSLTSIADAMLELYQNETYRNELQESGTVHARLFNVDRLASEIHGIYRELS